MIRSESGFTLVEIAVVLVIIGLLIGSVVRGEQMIQNARSRAVLTQTDAFRIAFLGFQDRYRALPGDYRDAIGTIPDVQRHGNGNGLIEGPALAPAPAPAGAADEDFLVWDHLSKAGFLRERFIFSDAVFANAVPRNLFGGYVGVSYDKAYGDPTDALRPDRHTLKTGNMVPVDILAEIDKKIDDGNGLTGSFVFSSYQLGGTAPAAPGANGCITSGGVWQTAAASPPMNCGGASFL
ncbi:MAG: type II secretion system protein [Burkholderiales bacterium]|nr:type II secretion system protein [Burkholderiales bacterium]